MLCWQKITQHQSRRNPTMTQSQPVLTDSFEASPPSTSSPRQSERLLVARIAWLVLATGLLGNFIASIPAYYTQLLTICTNPNTTQCGSFQPTTATLDALRHLNVSLSTYAAMYLAADVAISLTYLVVGALIFWRKS